MLTRLPFLNSFKASCLKAVQDYFSFYNMSLAVFLTWVFSFTIDVLKKMKNVHLPNTREVPALQKPR